MQFFLGTCRVIFRRFTRVEYLPRIPVRTSSITYYIHTPPGPGTYGVRRTWCRVVWSSGNVSELRGVRRETYHIVISFLFTSCFFFAICSLHHFFSLLPFFLFFLLFSITTFFRQIAFVHGGHRKNDICFFDLPPPHPDIHTHRHIPPCHHYDHHSTITQAKRSRGPIYMPWHCSRVFPLLFPRDPVLLFCLAGGIPVMHSRCRYHGVQQGRAVS